MPSATFPCNILLQLIPLEVLLNLAAVTQVEVQAITHMDLRMCSQNSVSCVSALI